jgi:hypothetical protein
MSTAGARTAMDKHDVCSNDPLKAKHGSTVRLENHTHNDVVVEDNGNPSTWPFADHTSPFTITLTKGYEDVVLNTTKGTYYYKTEGCPDDKKVNPKTVIIS